MKPAFPTILAANAGYVDTAGFLALQGLFTAHVTGNFVTIGAALVFGTSGVVAKLLALPTFCVCVLLSRLLRYRLQQKGVPVLRSLIALKVVLLGLGGFCAIRFGPFASGDGAEAIVTGMILVAAMAVQNAAHRVHLSAFPPSTLMTGTTTQIMLDLADLLQRDPAADRAAIHARLKRFIPAVLSFALGCAAAAIATHFAGVWAFGVPPVLGLIAYLIVPPDAPAAPAKGV